ncbi:MAG: hypothetical protein K2G26_02185, partial [Clostridia bacterium]|nr:hypothetical protein [Clostridia bacterium]
TWGNWTVATKPTNEATGKATRTCSGEGTCDAVATEKEATLPVLTSTDYTKGEDTATCQAAGTITYTYNKGGINVSFDVATPVNADKHTANCGHNTPAPTVHSHVWSEWNLDESITEGYAGEATRTCSGAGNCDADESLTTVYVPSALWGDDYKYAAPVHKVVATCQSQGVDTYTYTDTEKDISITFDVQLSTYGDHKIVGNECEVCHAPVVTAALDTEVTVEANSDTATILTFTAPAQGTYRFVYTQGVSANIDNYTVDFPASFNLAADEKLTFDIKAPVDPEAPEQTANATYKFKVVAVTVLEAEYDVGGNLVPSTAEITVGAGKTVSLDVRGSGRGTLSYVGPHAITLTGRYFNWSTYQIETLNIDLDGSEPYAINFGYPYQSIQFTVSSEANEEFQGEITLTFEEEEVDLEITIGNEKQFEDLGFEGEIYTLEIEEEGDYTITFRGADYLAGNVCFELRSDAEDGESVITADGGKYTLSVGTYYLLIAAEDGTVSGFVTVSKAKQADITVGVAVTVTGTDSSDFFNPVTKRYTVELEAGNYKVLINGEAIDLLMGSAVAIGSGYDEFSGEIIMLNNVTGNDKLVIVATAGIYEVEVYEDVTFTIVKEA